MLSPAMQKGVFDFIAKTQSASHNYRLQILYELSNAFGFKNLLFTLANYPEQTIGLDISEDMQSDYISYYHQLDLFQGRHAPKDAALSLQRIIDPMDFETSEYFNSFLSRYSFYYVACLPLYANTKVGPLLGCIELFRGKEEGDFTDEEMECLEYLSRYIANNLNYRVQLHTAQRERNTLKGSLQTLPIGYILTDADFHITYYNKTARDYALQFTHGLNRNPINDLHEKLIPYVVTSNLQFGNAIRVEFPPLAIEVNAFWSQDSLLETTVKDYVIYLWRKDALTSSDAKKLLSSYQLTKRELEMASMLLKGYSNVEIAEALHISYNTVKVHLKNIYGKMNVTNRPAAMAKLGSLHAVL